MITKEEKRVYFNSLPDALLFKLAITDFLSDEYGKETVPFEETPIFEISLCIEDFNVTIETRNNNCLNSVEYFLDKWKVKNES